jgi:septal ring factor EnvC (AmiA/AmiB activator)
MRRARRSSLLVLLLLTAQAGPVAGPVPATGPVAGPVPAMGPPTGQAPADAAESGTAQDAVPGQSADTAPAGPLTPLEREEAASRQAEDAERVRSMRADAEREATEQAAQALADEKRLTAAQTDALDRLKRAETAVNDMTRRMVDLNTRRENAQIRIDNRVEALGHMMPIILRMSDYPVETLLATQVPVEDAVRGILVLRTIARQAEADARRLLADRESLEAATREAEKAAPQLAAAEAARSYEADSLARDLAASTERRAAAEQDASDAAQAAAEAARAESLRSMVQILDTQRRLQEAEAREDALRADRDKKANVAESARLREAATAQPAGAGTIAADAKPAGQITLPVAGTLVRGWGDAENGDTATGQTWRAEPGARVLAPCGGTVAFAEPFHSYGLLVIIDCGGGYHAVLSGMSQIAVAPGRTIQIGDVVGAMQAGTQTASTTGAAQVEPPVLYFELRKGGRPIDPAPWLKPPGQ